MSSRQRAHHGAAYQPLRQLRRWYLGDLRRRRPAALTIESAGGAPAAGVPVFFGPGLLGVDAEAAQLGALAQLRLSSAKPWNAARPATWSHRRTASSSAGGG